ncbi:melanoma-associated antigen 8-like [Neophocaena asiaeorientalis asiaeorientalis]|uniref:Melanoma-associated antigen 8-like n=1 Tax=Neophocaena asiaeorientalis asiaeorientalis TaxID=1706337 RepID=A0A341AD64_NEOAA|nr:melanoma-associated antigen 8-like [Neophocaena asiaeorientalis asiaeorientalis]
MSELRQPEADTQAPVPAQGPVEASLLGAAGEEAASPSSSASPGAPSVSAYAEPLPQEALGSLMVDLVVFLLLKYRSGEPTSEVEMLSTVLPEHRDHFPEVFRHACECLQVVFGLDVREVGPRDRTYVLIPTLGLTWDAVLRALAFRGPCLGPPRPRPFSILTPSVLDPTSPSGSPLHFRGGSNHLPGSFQDQKDGTLSK